MDSLCLLRRIEREIDVDAPDCLEDGGRYIIGDQHRVSDVHPCMNNRVPRSTGRPWGLALIHHHGDLAVKMLFIEAERLFTISAEVQLRVEWRY